MNLELLQNQVRIGLTKVFIEPQHLSVNKKRESSLAVKLCSFWETILSEFIP